MPLDHAVDENVLLPDSPQGLVFELTRILNDYANMINDLVVHALETQAILEGSALVTGAVGIASTVSPKATGVEEVIATTSALNCAAGSFNLIWMKAANANRISNYNLRKGTLGGTILDASNAVVINNPGVCFVFDGGPATSQAYVLTNNGLAGDTIFAFNGMAINLLFPVFT